MASGFNNLMTVLIVIFVVTFLGLLAEIFYVLWRRRLQQYHQQPPTAAATSAATSTAMEAKERVYFFWWRKQSRIQPNEIPIGLDDESEADEDEEKNWRELCGGPSRVLFTINEEEEEREGIDASMESDRCSLDPAITIQIDDDPTPFGTPCASPPYYTPSPSPPREAAAGYASGESSAIVPPELLRHGNTVA